MGLTMIQRSSFVEELYSSLSAKRSSSEVSFVRLPVKLPRFSCTLRKLYSFIAKIEMDFRKEMDALCILFPHGLDARGFGDVFASLNDVVDFEASVQVQLVLCCPLSCHGLS